MKALRSIMCLRMSPMSASGAAELKKLLSAFMNRACAARRSFA